MTKQEYMAMSLPYGLHGKIKNTICELTRMGAYTINTKPSVHGHTYCLIEDFIPILRPLSDLPRLITQKGYNNEEPFFPLYRLQKEDKAFTTDFIHAFGVEECKFSVIELLLKWHFDLFGGIESGEAIDVNTLETNPYK